MENKETQHKRRVRYSGTHPRNYKEKYKEHNPEKYADLQIRVSGWNVLWNNINKEEQDGFIRQAEALV